jgi:hypothetical protein
VADFAHCRPVISVDGTFLTGKYKGTLMVTVEITVENQLEWYPCEKASTWSGQTYLHDFRPSP